MFICIACKNRLFLFEQYNWKSSQTVQCTLELPQSCSELLLGWQQLASSKYQKYTWHATDNTNIECPIQDVSEWVQ